MKKAAPKTPNRTKKAAPLAEGREAQARFMAGMRFALAGGTTPKGK